MRKKIKNGRPEWSRKIEAFRRTLNLSQSELGTKLEVSAMAVSRWERGRSQPPADAFIRIGKLAGDPLCWFFWGRAGLSTADVKRVLPQARRRFNANRMATVQVVHAGAEKKWPAKPATFVAVPLLPVRAATPGAKGDMVPDLDQVKPEGMLAAPKEWCPHPSSTVSLRVKGDSMSPLILDGYIIAVDTSDVSHDRLLGQIVVASSVDKACWYPG